MVAPVTSEQLEKKIYKILTTEDASNLSKKKVRALLSQSFGAALDVKKRKDEIKKITMKVVGKIQKAHGQEESVTQVNAVGQGKKTSSPQLVKKPSIPGADTHEPIKSTVKSYTDAEVSESAKKLLKSLTTADLQTLTGKAVRKRLEEKLGVSLKNQKKVVKMSVEMFTEELRRKQQQMQKNMLKKRKREAPSKPEGIQEKKSKGLSTEGRGLSVHTAKKRKAPTSAILAVSSDSEDEPIRMKKRKTSKTDGEGKKRLKEGSIKKIRKPIGQEKKTFKDRKMRSEVDKEKAKGKLRIPTKSKISPGKEKPAHREKIRVKSKSDEDKAKRIRVSNLKRAKKKSTLNGTEPTEPIEKKVNQEKIKVGESELKQTEKEKTDESTEKDIPHEEKTEKKDQVSRKENSKQDKDIILIKDDAKESPNGGQTLEEPEKAGGKMENEPAEKQQSPDVSAKQDTLLEKNNICEPSTAVPEKKDVIETVVVGKEDVVSDKITEEEIDPLEAEESPPPPYLDEEPGSTVSLNELLESEDWTMRTVFESAKAELRKNSVEVVAEKAFKVIQSRFGDRCSMLPAALYPLLVKYKLDANWQIPSSMEPFIFSVFASCSVDFLTYLRVHGVPAVAKDDKNRTLLHLVSYSLARASHNMANDSMWSVFKLLKSSGFSLNDEATKVGTVMDILEKYGTPKAVSRAKALIT